MWHLYCLSFLVRFCFCFACFLFIQDGFPVYLENRDKLPLSSTQTMLTIVMLITLCFRTHKLFTCRLFVSIVIVNLCPRTNLHYLHLLHFHVHPVHVYSFHIHQFMSTNSMFTMFISTMFINTTSHERWRHKYSQLLLSTDIFLPFLLTINNFNLLIFYNKQSSQ